MRKTSTPDTFVVFGVEKCDRRTFKTWQETWQENNKTQDFVLEVTSKTTRIRKLLTHTCYNPTGWLNLNPE